MNLQMQLKRGLVALAVWTLLGGFVLSRAGSGAEHAATMAVHAALQSGQHCDASLRIDLSRSVRVTVPCDWSCAPVREVMQVLHVPVRETAASCVTVRTA